jgi:hypothetical protein
MFSQQAMQTVSRFGIKSGTKNPQTGDTGHSIEVSHEQGATDGMELQSLCLSGRQHLPTQHVVDEAQGANATKLFDGKTPVHHVNRKSPRTNRKGNGLMQN